MKAFRFFHLVLLAALIAVTLIAGGRGVASPGTTQGVSVDGAGNHANGNSYSPAISAAAFDPVVSLAVSNNEVGKDAAVTITITQRGGEEYFDIVTFKAPPGWFFNEGTSISAGAVVAVGLTSLVYRGVQYTDIPMEMVNLLPTEGHKATWQLRFPPPFCCLELFLDGSTELGHQFTVNPILPVDTPEEVSLTILGSVNGTTIIHNPAASGDYVWSVILRSLSGQVVTREATVTIGGAGGPVGGIVELRHDSSAPSAYGSDSPVYPYITLAALATVALLALTAGAWYARRRWLA